MFATFWQKHPLKIYGKVPLEIQFCFCRKVEIIIVFMLIVSQKLDLSMHNLLHPFVGSLLPVAHRGGEEGAPHV